MTKLRAELVLEYREFRDRIWWEIKNWSGHVLAVIVRAFDHEVVVARPIPTYCRPRSYAYSTRTRYTCASEGQINNASTAWIRRERKFRCHQTCISALHLRIGRVDERRRFRHLYLSSHTAHVQRQIRSNRFIEFYKRLACCRRESGS